MLARMKADLGHTARFVGARTPEQLEARMVVLEEDDREPEPAPEHTPSGEWR